MSLIKIGIVGLGRISPNHLEAIGSFSGFYDLVSICDTDESKLNLNYKFEKVKKYTDLCKMLQDQELDLVSLCTPSGLHAQQAIACAKAGKHVVCEKPMATKLAHALRMLDAFDKYKKTLFVVKQNRLNPTLQKLKQALDEGRFGRMSLVIANVLWTRPQAYYDQASWRGTWEFDGGAFLNQASHYVDLLCWLLGPIQSVSAVTKTRMRKIEAEDSGIMSIEWRDGTIGTLNVSMLTWPRNFEGSLTLIGETGTVRIGGMALNKIEHWDFKESHPMDEDIKSVNQDVDSVYGHGHKGYYLEVYKHLQGEASQAVLGRDGIKSLEAIVAAYRSNKVRRTLCLPLGI